MSTMVYVGGSMNGRVSLHDLKSGKRLIKNGYYKDIEFLYYNNWRTQSYKYV